MPHPIQLDLAQFLVRLIEQTPERDAWSTLMAIKRIAHVNIDMVSPTRRAVATIEQPKPILAHRSKPEKSLAALGRSA